MAQAIKLCFLQLQQLFCGLKNKPHIQADVKKNKIPLSCNVRKKFLDPFEIEGVLFTIWEITCQGNF